jgi:hypothetical protein
LQPSTAAASHVLSVLYICRWHKYLLDVQTNGNGALLQED